jgi:hypothetical protein
LKIKELREHNINEKQIENATTKEIRYNSSSKRYKKNIKNKLINSNLIYKLRLTEYDALDDDTKTNILGYIAEEVAELAPEFAGYIKDEEGNMIPDCIDWFKILMYAVEELKQHNKQIKDIYQRLKILENLVISKEP